MASPWGFERVDERFEWVDRRFEQVDQRFEQVDQRFEQVDKRFEQVDQRFEQFHADQRELRLATERGLSELRQETRALVEGLNARFDAMQRILIAGLLGGAFTVLAGVLGVLAAVLL